MSDNKKHTGRADRVRVDPDDPGEVQYLRRKYPMLTRLAVKKAIIVHGPYRKRVVAVLDKVKEHLGCR